MEKKALRHFSMRAALLLALMLTATTAWAFKTETVSYIVSRNGSTITISGGGESHSCDVSSSMGNLYTWNANASCGLANGMTIKPSAAVTVTGTPITTASTTFTFTTSGTTAITGVTFKKVNENVGSSTSSEPVTTFSITIPANTTFTSFEVTFGYISGKCGTSATWSLAKQSGQYTALTIGGSGAMSNYSAGATPWGSDLTTATVGSDITAIGNNAFNGCTALTRVDVQKTDGLVTLGSGVFTDCNALAAIVVPTPAIAVGYQTAANWSTHASKLRVALGSYLFAATDEGGTAAYAITSETDLRNLSAYVNAGNSYYSADSKPFRQTANITLNGNFDPIGNETGKSFYLDTYDGGGYTISGLNVNYYIDQYAWHGLFGYVNEGTVKNVVLINPSFPNNNHSGALIGKLDGGTAMNCYAYGTGTLIKVQGGNPTVTNVGRARKVTLGSGITVSPAATDIANGFVYNNESYYREGLTLTLGATVPTGYTAVFSANGTVIDGDTYTVNSTDGDVTVSVVWTENVLTLLNNDSAQPEGSKNADIIAAAEASGKTYNRVTLQGRTLKKNNEWNTLVLPFSLDATALAASPLAGATIMEMQNTTSLENGVLTLNFAAATEIEAGKPYLIKWASADDIVAPVFTGVTIASTTPTGVTSTDGKVTFVGQYAPFTINSSNKDNVLMLGSGNKIGYSNNDRTLKCFRAHFEINDVTAVREYNMNFDGETTSIQEVYGVHEVKEVNGNSCYTLDGRKVANPTKGLYIINGKKVAIK